MLFFIKKTISIFLMPLSLVLILLFIGLFFLFINKYKKAKTFLSFGFIFLFLISYEPFANSLIKPLETKYKSYTGIDSNIKYVLVLGNAHTTNPNVSLVSQLSNTALKRLSEGIRVYRQLDNAKLIVSGYAGNDKLTAHAVISKNAAISLGVEAKNILTQEKAKDTIEEANYVKQTVGKEKFILVTSASHMPRAMKIFKSKGLNPIAAPTEFSFKKNINYLTFPSVSNIGKTTLAFHEYIGTFWFEIVRLYRLYLN
ncbi:envelope biogenesis factor ElyC [Halarcobacter sp.]|uniref:envelope biogenesis factor ElyC n=1 Tax=Halarcobacter sp. TaxID=2321133 RepID=UPI0029F462BE|nr:envelope biogenesis factor ElyC [Halarcobacter sp.]